MRPPSVQPDGFGREQSSGGIVKTEHIKAGTLIDGQRVTSMARGMVNGRQCARFGLDGGPLGRAHYFGNEVPGTGYRTDIPAGPTKGGGFCVKDRLIGPRRRGESEQDRNFRQFGGKRAMQMVENM